MKMIVTESMFRSQFYSCGRNEQFSYEALGLIFEHIEAYEADTGEETELDVVEICCNFVEASDEEIASDYDIDIEGLNGDEIQEAVEEYLQDNTTVVGRTSTGFIYQNF